MVEPVCAATQPHYELDKWQKNFKRNSGNLLQDKSAHCITGSICLLSMKQNWQNFTIVPIIVIGMSLSFGGRI